MKIVPVLAVVAGYSLTSLVSTSCVKRNYNQVSKTQEAFGLNNNAKSMGISKVYTWDALQQLKEAQVAHPWSDTYWPLSQTGLSFRWMTYDESNKITVPPNFSTNPDSIYTQLNEMNMAILSKNIEVINILSPAEKYELVASGGKAIPTNILQSLQNQYKNTIGVLSQKQNQLNEINKKRAALEEESEKLYEAIESLNSRKTELQNTIDTNPTEAETAKIEMAKIDIEIKTKTEKEDSLSTQISAAYTDIDKIETEVTPLRKQFLSKQNDVSRGPVANAYPMFASGWRDYSYYSTTYQEEYEWGWMGHCHGWSPASLLEPKPAHGAVIKTGNVEVFFFEGDIRGLLSKVWAEQSGSSYFGGNRCNVETYSNDRRGRILDGVICYNATSSQKECKFEAHQKDGKILFLRQQFQQNGQLSGISFVEKKFDPQPKMGTIVRSVGQDTYWMDIYTNVNDYNAKKAPVRALVNVSIGCRDLNPGLLHLSLHDLIGVRKIGFVMDQTRNAQVWNQPTYAYKWESLPILKKDKTSSAPDELVAIDQIVDPFKHYRASGTQYLVQIKNSIKFGSENGPNLAYTPEMDDDGTIDVIYTLELNSSKEIIGGEWGLIPIPRDLKDTEKKVWIGGRAPDFIWRPIDGAKPTRGVLKYDVISKIHECSLKAATEKRTIGNKELDVSVCSM